MNRDQPVTKQVLDEVIADALQRVDRQFEEAQLRADRQFDDVLQVLSSFIGDVDERFTGLERRTDHLEIGQASLLNQMTKLTDEMIAQRSDTNRIFTYLDSIEKQLEIHEHERLATNFQLNRLNRWVPELATKTGHSLSAE